MELLSALTPGVVYKEKGKLLDTLHHSGTIFAVFDKQDSGNIAYGWNVGGRKIWLKKGSPDLEPTLRNAESFYAAFTHPLIPRYLGMCEFSDGIAVFSDWVEGEVLNAAGVDRNNPASAFQRFLSLRLDMRIEALSRIYGLFVELEKAGFVIEDFYDGCIIYDFECGELSVCDLDHAHPGPFVLDRDRLYGSRRYMAPEEFRKGSIIDHRTNVYNLGAAAFVFIGRGIRDKNSWEGSPRMYDVAWQAVSNDPTERQQTIAQFYTDWEVCAAL